MGNEQKQYYIDCIDRGIKLYWRTLCKARNMRIHTGDIERAVSEDGNGPERVFSVQLSSEDAERRIDEIIRGINESTIPNGILITPNSRPANIVELFEARGFAIDTSSPGMVMELADFKPYELHNDRVCVIKVEDDDSLKKWVDIVNYDFYIMSYEQFYDIYRLPYVSLYLSIYDNTPAGTFMIIRDGNFSVLEMVNTRKEYQRKGIATTALSYIFNGLKEDGIDIVTLRSSTEGIRLYTKMGFKEYCKRILATYSEEMHK